MTIKESAYQRRKRVCAEKDVCYGCGQYPPSPGNMRCYFCKEKHNVVSARHFAANREQQIKRIKSFAAKAKAEGRCFCGHDMVPEMDEGFKCCWACRNKLKKSKGPNQIYMERLRQIVIKEKNDAKLK